MRLQVDQPMTLAEIARKYGVALGELERHNPGIGSKERVLSVEAPVEFERASLQRAGEQAAATAGRSDRSIALGATASSPGPGQLLRLQVEKELNAMQDFAAARLALFAQHTVSRPTIKLDESAKRLAAFGAKNSGLAKEAFVKRVAANKSIQDDAIAFLKLRFTPVDLHGVDANADYGAAMLGALDVVPAMDAAHKAEFVEVLFNLAHPANHQAMWETVLAAIPAADLEKLLLARLRSSNDLHINNALHLPYYVYGRKPDYAMSAAGRAEFAQAVAALRAKPNLNLIVREGLAEATLP